MPRYNSDTSRRSRAAAAAFLCDLDLLVLAWGVIGCADLSYLGRLRATCSATVGRAWVCSPLRERRWQDGVDGAALLIDGRGGDVQSRVCEGDDLGSATVATILPSVNLTGCHAGSSRLEMHHNAAEGAGGRGGRNGLLLHVLLPMRSHLIGRL
jgi:hypothetical protein